MGQAFHLPWEGQRQDHHSHRLKVLTVEILQAQAWEHNCFTISYSNSFQAHCFSSKTRGSVHHRKLPSTAFTYTGSSLSFWWGSMLEGLHRLVCDIHSHHRQEIQSAQTLLDTRFLDITQRPCSQGSKRGQLVLGPRTLAHFLWCPQF